MVVKRALAESRPWLLVSLVAAISYFFVSDAPIPGLYLMLWKGLGVGFLAVFALVRHHSADGRMIGAVMALGAIGDMLIEIDMIYGAVAFLFGHVVAIWLYARHRRASVTFSQRLFALLLVPCVVLIAWALPMDRSGAGGIALYSLFLAVMAAMAWTSDFPRYRVGFGALMFVVSDLLIFARLGPLEGSAIPDWLIWPLYYFGQFLICTGVIQSLRHKDPRVAG
ncbi:lysoplasmalogenase [Blastomonas sp. SL216]|uniref:lysoplasmalogenase n=1 Tax=Blastomonas sp. SL216 TaxID=2995169 RepID=UPI002376E6DC|nr:lysoplasmalogenase [Blastomonas sp. SL216]